MSWTYTTTDQPHAYALCYGHVGQVVEAWWIHEPEHPAVTMARIVDRLNLPAAQCTPSRTPSWSMMSIETSPNSIPRHWQSYFLDGHEVLGIVWSKTPRSFDGWHQRILDALNAGRGLPAVAVPTLQARAA